MISPTGKLNIRASDRWGEGNFGKPRGMRKHLGLDFAIQPNMPVYFPFKEGIITRVARPYVQDKRYSGCRIEAEDAGLEYICKLFYFNPDINLITYKDTLVKWDVIGFANDLNSRYPDIINHVHIQVRKKGQPNKWFNPIAIMYLEREEH